jgi:hypothetical protein
MCAIGLLTLLVLQLAIGFAVNLTESSDEFLRTGIRLNRGSRALRQLDKKFFRSCRPLKWKIGNCFTLTRFTFPQIFDGIIIAACSSICSLRFDQAKQLVISTCNGQLLNQNYRFP